MKPRIFDQAITDDELLLEIEQSKSIFPESMGDGERIGVTITQYHDPSEVDCYAPFMFWDGWWSSPANTTKKKMIKSLIEDRLPIPTRDICGIEYWTRTFGPNQFLSWHVDEDTYEYENTRGFNCPELGFIYYPHFNEENDSSLIISNAKIHGNPTSVLEMGVIHGLMEFAPGETVVNYKPNRLIMFDAGRSLHRTTKSTTGSRRVMVINIWSKENAPLALKLGKFVYE